MKYAFIQRNRLVWPISMQCRVLEVSVSGYHEHLARRRHMRSAATSATTRYSCISTPFMPRSTAPTGGRASGGNCSSAGIRVGKQRVQKLMQQHGIIRGKRQVPSSTTDSKHDSADRAQPA